MSQQLTNVLFLENYFYLRIVQNSLLKTQANPQVKYIYLYLHTVFLHLSPFLSYTSHCHLMLVCCLFENNVSYCVMPLPHTSTYTYTFVCLCYVLSCAKQHLRYTYLSSVYQPFLQWLVERKVNRVHARLCKYHQREPST